MKEIYLTKSLVSVVDDEDWEFLKDYKWHAVKGSRNRTWYARRCVRVNGGFLAIFMHRVIMTAPRGMVVDHIDHDTLNNRRGNLRVCTQHENLLNRRIMPKSGYHGVNLYKPNGLWVAHYKGRHVGYFESCHEAALAYNAYAFKVDGFRTDLNDVEGYGKKFDYKLPERSYSSRYRGVDRRGNSWRVSMQVDNRRVHIGSFGSEREAVDAYNDKCIELGLYKRVQEVV